MKRITIITVIIFSFGKLFAQEEKTLENLKFDLSVFQYNIESDYYFCLPWNYNITEEKSERFPLVIYLHGGGGYGVIGTNLNYLGYSDANGVENQAAKNFQINHPSFILVPQSKKGWDPDKLIPIVEHFKSIYPIDNRRIYLIGYSMGGSGSYIFANKYYDYNQTLFAAIIRLAGQNQVILRDSITHNTSVWLHIGLNDDQKRIDNIREAYNYLRLKHSDAIESVEPININGITGTTLTVHSNNSEVFKKTEYNDVGHGINRFPFDDNTLISWLFKQKLD